MGTENDPAEEPEGSRVSSAPVAIDYEDTLRFFEGRAERAQSQPLLTAVLYQDSEPELAARRDSAEWELMRSWLSLDRRPRVLDIGCGVGRWGAHLAGSITSYLGVDFSPGLVTLARENLSPLMGDAEWAVQVGSAPELGSLSLEVPAPFDLVIIAGVLVYLNDDDVRRTLAAVGPLTRTGTEVFVREPVAVETRLTLRHHWSEELRQDYSAVYREASHYRATINDELGRHGLVLVKDEPMSDELRNRSETSQHYFLGRRP